MRAGSIGASIFLIAIGAVMAYAVTVETEGFNINTAGVILMIVGALGLVLSLLMMFLANDRPAATDTHTERVVERDRTI